MRPRKLGAAVALVLVAATLTACRTNVGTAAKVDGKRISETDVNKYVARAGIASSVAAAAKAQNQPVPIPRALVLSVLIEQKVFEHALRRTGGVPSDGQLNAYRDQTVTELLGVTGAAADKQLRTLVESRGVTTNFAPVLLRTTELQFALSARRAQIGRGDVHVSVSPRYGVWDAQRGLLTSPDDGLPSFVKLQPTPTPVPTDLGLTPP